MQLQTGLGHRKYNVTQRSFVLSKKTENLILNTKCKNVMMIFAVRSFQIYVSIVVCKRVVQFFLWNHSCLYAITCSSLCWSYCAFWTIIERINNLPIHILFLTAHKIKTRKNIGICFLSAGNIKHLHKKWMQKVLKVNERKKNSLNALFWSPTFLYRWIGWRFRGVSPLAIRQYNFDLLSFARI